MLWNWLRRHDAIGDKGCVIIGSPDEVVAHLRQVATDLNVGHLMLLLQFGNMNKGLAQYNTRLFAEKGDAAARRSVRRMGRPLVAAANDRRGARAIVAVPSGGARGRVSANAPPSGRQRDPCFLDQPLFTPGRQCWATAEARADTSLMSACLLGGPTRHRVDFPTLVLLRATTRNKSNSSDGDQQHWFHKNRTPATKHIGIAVLLSPRKLWRAPYF